MKDQKNQHGKYEAFVCEIPSGEFIAEVYYKRDSSGFSRQYDYGETAEIAREKLVSILWDDKKDLVVFPQFNKRIKNEN